MSRGTTKPVTNSHDESFTEYFSPERYQYPVRRGELLAILTQHHKTIDQGRWWKVLGRWLLGRLGKPVEKVPSPEAR